MRVAKRECQAAFLGSLYLLGILVPRLLVLALLLVGSTQTPARLHPL